MAMVGPSSSVAEPAIAFATVAWPSFAAFAVEAKLVEPPAALLGFVALGIR